MKNKRVPYGTVPVHFETFIGNVVLYDDVRGVRMDKEKKF